MQKAINVLILDLLDELLLVLGLPWRLSCDHLVEDDPECPDIGLERVLVAFQGLGGHVERGTDVVLV